MVHRVSDADIINQTIGKIYGGVITPYNDGWTQWACKKQLYEIKFKLDKLLAECPTFVGEEEFLEDQEKNKTWNILKDQ